MKTELYRKKQVIVREGEPGDCMFYIRWGRAAAYVGYGTPDEQLLANLGTGDYFGEMSLLDHERRSATVVSLEADTTLSRISADDFSEFIAEEPNRAFDILRNLSHKLRKVTDNYVDLCRELETSQEGELGKNRQLRQVHNKIAAAKARGGHS